MSLSSSSLQPVTVPLVGFTEDSVKVEGEITLPVMAGTSPCQSTVLMRFLVVRVPLAYNAILGRPGLNILNAVISIKCLLVRFPISEGVGEMREEQNLVQLCCHMAPSPRKVIVLLTSELLDPRESEKREESAEHLLTFPLGAKTVQIGELLPMEAKNQLLAFLQANSDIFA